ncbi:MAG: tetrahydrofolate synthase [Prevotella salivae]|nr:tetrahydrofolate synthase [Segatella salivae]
MNEPLKMIIPNLQRRRVHAAFSINISGIINAFATQCHEYCGKFSMNTAPMSNVITMQCCGCYANISINISTIMNVLTTQLGTSCSFDSPGLARNEPTPGKRLQGDSTL